MVRPFINQKKPSDRKQNVMDDITHGQWSKNHYNSNNNNNNDDEGSMEYYHTDSSIPNDDDILDPYTMQKSFRKMAKKLSRRL
jgi:hypothetical protein